MSLAIWIAIAVAVLASFAPITQGGLRKINEKELGKYVRKVGLPLPTQLRTPLIGRIAARERWSLTGGVVGLVLGMITALAAGWHDAEGGVLIMLAMPFGASLGGVLSMALGRHQFNPDAPRMARAKATELGDYLTRGELLSARIAPVAAILAPLAGTLLLRLLPSSESFEISWWLAMAWAAAGITILVWIGTELAARKVLQSAQHAESRLELAWDDVCRAESLRGLYNNPVALAVLSSLASLLMVGLVAIDPSARAEAMNLTAGVGIGMLVISMLTAGAVLLPRMISWFGPYRQQVLRRLWAGEDFTTEAREQTC